MDRQIVWPGAIPLETDILNTNRYAMIGLGRLAMDVLGSTTVVSALPCTPTAVPSMTVNIGAGAIYSLQNIDGTAYSSLPANTADQIVKQGILLASANQQLSMVAAGTSGQSVIYLIEAAYSEVDTNAVVLPYYNASNPSVAYSGPANSGSSNFTKRPGTVNVQAKAGIAATTPTAPAVDSGFVPLYYVTIAYGQTTITAPNITLATGAPFITPGSSYMPIAGGTFTGAVSGPVPSSGDNSAKLATTSWFYSAIATVAAAAGFAVSLTSSSSWYIKLPSWLGGWIVQGGSIAVTSGSNVTTTSVAFPLTFGTICLGAIPSQTTSANGAGWHPLVCGALSQSTTGFTLQADTANAGQSIAASVTANYVAFGK
jgi:hypothetical protein